MAETPRFPPCPTVSLPLWAGLTACGERPVSARLQIHTRNATAAQVAETARILHLRFDDSRQSWVSSVTSTIEGNRIDFEFHGKSPAEATVRYLGTTQGVYRIAVADAPLIAVVTDQDIASSSCFRSSDGFYLLTELKPAGAARMLAATRRNLGKVLVTTWDGREIVRATVAGVFGDRFQTPIPKTENINGFCMAIRHGRLPVRIERAEFSDVT